MDKQALVFNLDLFFDIKDVDQGRALIEKLKNDAAKKLEDAEMITKWFNEYDAANKQ